MNPTKPQRIWLMDALRGIALLMMIAFHLVFDLSFFLGTKAYHESGFWYWEGRVSAMLFILLAGVASGLIARKYPAPEALKKNLRRAGRLLGLATLITLATWFFDKNWTVWFGILHFLGLSVLITLPLLRFRRLNLVLAAGAFALGPFWTSLIVFQTFDYIPFFPWIGFFLIGIALGNFLHEKNPTLPAPGFTGKALSFLGRHSLLIYLIHQPMIIGAITLLMLT